MKLLFLALLVALTSPLVEAREIGSVSTTFRAMGSNDKIVIESIDDPDVQNVACYISRAKTSLLISEYSTGYSEKHFRQKSVSSSVRSIPCLLLHLNLNSFSLISKGIASIKVSLCSYLACFKLHQDHQTFPLVVCSILLFEISLILSLL